MRMVKEIEKRWSLYSLRFTSHLHGNTNSLQVFCYFLLQFCPVVLKSPQILHQNPHFLPLFTLLILLKCYFSFRCSPASCGWFQYICITQPNTSRKPLCRGIHLGALLEPATNFHKVHSYWMYFRPCLSVKIQNLMNNWAEQMPWAGNGHLHNATLKKPNSKVTSVK